MYRHFFDPIAYSEYIDALKWYAVRSNKAAENFVKEIDIAIALICKDPFRFRNSYKLFRETSLKSYPFYVVYFIDEQNKTVIIATIYHHKRNPARKYKK